MIIFITLLAIDGDSMRRPFDIENDIQVTSLLVYNDLLWIGTNVGAILNLPVPDIMITTSCIQQCPPITLLSCGHYDSVDMLSVIISTTPFDTEISDVGSSGHLNSPTLSRSSSHGRDDNTSYTEGITTVFVVSCGRGCRTYKNSVRHFEDEKLPNGTKALTLLFWKVSEFNV